MFKPAPRRRGSVTRDREPREEVIDTTPGLLVAAGARFSWVLDSDGDPTNDWQWVSPWDFDLFQETDRWYQLVFDHMSKGTWSITCTQVSSTQTTSPCSSDIRAVIDGDQINFLLPVGEIPAAESDGAGYRVTAFGHDGYYSVSDRGADVSGVDPTEPLEPLELDL